MNTVKQRLENRTNAVLNALEKLSKLSNKGNHYTDQQVEKIKLAIAEAVTKSMSKLRERADMISFKLAEE